MFYDDLKLNETPLHFACKYGYYDMIKLFLSFNCCSKIAPNKNSKTPYELICTKSNQNSNISQIKSLFNGNFFTKLKETRKIFCIILDNYYLPFISNIDDSNVVSIMIEEPITLELLEKMKSENQIIGFMGPSSLEKCLKINEILKASEQKRKTNDKMDKIRNFKRLARIISSNYEIELLEYWPFVDCFININSNEGLQKLDIYLCNRTNRPDNFKNNYEIDKQIYLAIRDIPINHKLFPTLYEFKNSYFDS
jgi:ankyrin repeat and LEM domain-containing protein 2